MPKTLDEMMQELPKERQEKIEARYQELREEYLTLQELRKARKLTQERMAEMLHVQQFTVSKMEKRTDLLLSTLRSYIEAMGGDLKLIVQFPDRTPVLLKGLSELENMDALPDSLLPRQKKGRENGPDFMPA